MNDFGRPARQLFRLEPGIDFLNHGSFGAPPLQVLAEAERWRARMEANPDHFFREVLPQALRSAADELARFVRADPADLVFVENATAAVNAVLRSLDFKPGDEILLNSQSYGAVRQAVRYVCERSGAQAAAPLVSLPVQGREQLIQAFAGTINPRTRLVIVDHISSPTGLIWPVAEIAALARERGALVLVDGAHAPGQVDLDIPALGADWYTGNCHKWLYAPRGCAFLWSRHDRKPMIHPLAISHAYGRGFADEFDWTGTRDFSAWLAVGVALRFLDEFGVESVRRYCHSVATAAAEKIAQAWAQPLGASPTLHGAMMAIRLPPAWQRSSHDRESASRLQSALLAKERIVVALAVIQGALWARISAQIYNEPQDYERLIEAGLRGPR
jgi:isopenicillin-N epimerase